MKIIGTIVINPVYLTLNAQDAVIPQIIMLESLYFFQKSKKINNEKTIKKIKKTSSIAILDCMSIAVSVNSNMDAKKEMFALSVTRYTTRKNKTGRKTPNIADEIRYPTILT